MLAHLNDCAHCHITKHAPADLEDSDIGIKRATDAHGFFVPQAVLLDDSIIADHRPRELNSEDPFVKVHCGEDRRDSCAMTTASISSATTKSADRSSRCGSSIGSQATVYLTYANRAGWLYERMTARAQRFAPAFRRCGVGNPHLQALDAPRVDGVCKRSFLGGDPFLPGFAGHCRADLQRPGRPPLNWILGQDPRLATSRQSKRAYLIPHKHVSLRRPGRPVTNASIDDRHLMPSPPGNAIVDHLQ